MKTNKFFLIAFIVMMMQSANSLADDRMIHGIELPAAAQTFIWMYFPQQTVTYAEVDGFLKPTFEVWLSDGTKIEFNRNGIWDSVECSFTAVPPGLVPLAINDYVRNRFVDTTICRIDIDRHGYDIELSNGIELKFDRNCLLTRIDD